MLLPSLHQNKKKLYRILVEIPGDLGKVSIYLQKRNDMAAIPKNFKNSKRELFEAQYAKPLLVVSIAILLL